MKTLLTALSICAVASAGSFAFLLVEDRTLGLALPYSVPMAFAAMMVAGPALQLLAAHVWPQRRIVVREVKVPVPVAAPAAAAVPQPEAAPVAPAPPKARVVIRRRRPAAQGVVLLDVSRPRPRGRVQVA